MEVQISWIGVILATVSAMVVGSIWYSKSLFGGEWTKATGMSDASMKKAMPKAMPQLLIAAFLTAFVLAHVAFMWSQFYNYSFFKSAIVTAFWLWLGISATTLAAHEAFDERRKKLLWVNIGNRFATYMVMALIIGWIGV